MSDFLFALNAVSPIVLMVLFGYLLKRIGLLPKAIATQLNKIVFRTLLPIMLGLNIYKIQFGMQIDFSFILFGIGFLLTIFFLFLWPICRLVPKKSQRGVVLQAVFRSNYALIGIPLATALYGEEGAILSTIMSVFTIPLFNMLAVFCLSLFSDQKANYKKILFGILKNPLIIGVASSALLLLIRLLFVRLGISFRLSDLTPLYKVLNDLSDVATPLALLCLGANFEFSAIPALKKQIAMGVLLRCVIVPILGIGSALLLGCFEGGHFAVFIALFTTPLAVSAVPMAQEMNGDHELAGQILVFTTIFSTFSIFLATFVFRLLGIF